MADWLGPFAAARLLFTVGGSAMDAACNRLYHVLFDGVDGEIFCTQWRAERFGRSWLARTVGEATRSLEQVSESTRDDGSGVAFSPATRIRTSGGLEVGWTRTVRVDVDLTVLPEGGRHPQDCPDVQRLTRWRDAGIRIAREHALAWGLLPSVVVDSGWGLHLYFLLKACVRPDALEGIQDAMNGLLRGDPKCTPTGMTRAPGTWNRKVPGSHRRARIYTTHSVTYEPDQLARRVEELDAPLEPPRVRQAPVLNGEHSVLASASYAALPPAIQAIIERDPYARACFEGRGRDQGDQSQSGYDFSLARRLIRLGHDDPGALVAALASRHRANRRGASYYARTVQRALESVRAVGADGVAEEYRWLEGPDEG